ncbi:MAG: ribosome biogenesis GTP-binding protein YihA/YsxC [Luteolibacter sp.]|jgi:GTP-binding protein
MKIRSAEFITSAAEVTRCPAWDHPEAAFIGRSNVGKSSLINMLVHRKHLAKVSATPGKTQLLNFFLINNVWSLVDLPGYGYAKTSKTGKHEFNELVANYLVNRKNLIHTFVLIDVRLEPQKIDLAFIEWLIGTPAPYSLVFTKADKQSPVRNRASIESFLAALTHLRRPPAREFLCSSTKGTGRDDLLRFLGDATKR